MLPILAINIVVVAAPAFSSVYYSMTKWSGIGTAEWVGLANYQTLFADPGFHHAFMNNVLWLAMFLTIPIAMALVGGSLLAPIKRGAIVFRMSLFIPYVLPSVVSAALAQPVQPGSWDSRVPDGPGRAGIQQGVPGRLANRVACDCLH